MINGEIAMSAAYLLYHFSFCFRQDIFPIGNLARLFLLPTPPRTPNHRGQKNANDVFLCIQEEVKMGYEWEYRV